jgi:hypothetical protein
MPSSLNHSLWIRRRRPIYPLACLNGSLLDLPGPILEILSMLDGLLGLYIKLVIHGPQRVAVQRAVDTTPQDHPRRVIVAGGEAADRPAPPRPPRSAAAARTGPHRTCSTAWGQLQPGDEILIGRTDGTTIRFLVGRLEQHPKTALPSSRIWTKANRPLLRLITCPGSFDHATRHYRDNLIVYASPTGN